MLNTIAPQPNIKLVVVLTADTGGTVSFAAFSPSLAGSPMVGWQMEANGTLIEPRSATLPGRAILRKQLSVLPTALDPQARLRERWPSIIAQAQEFRQTIPDPVQSLIDLLGSLPGSYETWREILEEPYG